METEAIRLAEIVAEIQPGDAEVRGLLALLLHTQARATARRDSSGAFVPLLEQDEARWDSEMIESANRHLEQALALRSIGVFQLHAAIQAAHNARPPGGAPDWQDIDRLYQGILAIAPSIGAAVSAAAARLETGQIESAVALLDDLDLSRTQHYQPYWVTCARSHELRSDPEQAVACLDRAMALTNDGAVRSHLDAWSRRLGGG